ncbi:hypothetical protein F3Y22_tig00111084pilonHSYRG00011 [Hibiscus syriacus]|uniref:Uncharacterized protein n=1 Tax=Hibiscus syriacus TaxID=106335 RepID=A0A6A2Z2M1_HIBSY|nr:hypothetical protein F3Y22_tig00111084pilonHSYRG00011 [Hibiscus syriacus]
MTKANIVLPSPHRWPLMASTREMLEFALAAEIALYEAASYDVFRSLLYESVNLHIYEAELFLRSSVGRGINDISPGLVEGPAPIGGVIANLDNRARSFIEESGSASVGHIRSCRLIHIFHKN